MSNKKVNPLFLPLFYQFQGFFHPLKSHYAISGENYALIAESSNFSAFVPILFSEQKNICVFPLLNRKVFYLCSDKSDFIRNKLYNNEK